MCGPKGTAGYGVRMLEILPTQLSHSWKTEQVATHPAIGLIPLKISERIPLATVDRVHRCRRGAEGEEPDAAGGWYEETGGRAGAGFAVRAGLGETSRMAAVDIWLEFFVGLSSWSTRSLTVNHFVTGQGVPAISTQGKIERRK